jgi:hypothetical protein
MFEILYVACLLLLPLSMMLPKERAMVPVQIRDNRKSDM